MENMSINFLMPIYIIDYIANSFLERDDKRKTRRRGRGTILQVKYRAVFTKADFKCRASRDNRQSNDAKMSKRSIQTSGAAACCTNSKLG